MQKTLISASIAAALFAASGIAAATPFTTTSPTGGPLPAGVTQVGGIVLDLTGANGARVVSQLAASSLFSGTGSANQLIGTQTGFGPGVTGALGGGLLGASIRITLFDGDSGIGNFDFNDNTLTLNSISFGNFSTVPTQNTNNTGTVQGGSGLGTGFRNNILDTGFFSSTDPTVLSNFFSTLVSTEQVAYRITDVDPGDNVLDFTQGVDGGLVDVGSPPVVTPPPTGGSAPEPSALALIGLGMAAFGAIRRRRKD
jgi:hypothetical protein